MTALYFYNNLNQAPGLAQNALPSYIQGVNYLKGKTAIVLNICENQLQNTVRAVYPILAHPRRSTISGILFSTRCIANLTGMKAIYRILSKRTGRTASIEYQILLKLKELSSYCKELSLHCISWKKLPATQTLDDLKQQLDNLFDSENITITKAISCCDETRILIALHSSMGIAGLTPEELQIIQENPAMASIFSAIEENTGEALGGYAHQVLGPALNELLNVIPNSYNPLLLVSNSLINKVKKISTTIAGSCIFSITSANYLVSTNTAKILLQLSVVSGISAIGLYFQDHLLTQQAEETAKEILQMFLEITCSYVGMLLFGTDESFQGYLYKIVPAALASKATEQYLDSRQSCAVTSFAVPFLMSSIVYNQADIRILIPKKYTQLKQFSSNLLNGKIKKQIFQLFFLQPVAALSARCITSNISNRLSRSTVQSLSQINSSSEISTLISNILWVYPPLVNALDPFILPQMSKHLNPIIEQQILQTLSRQTSNLNHQNQTILTDYLRVLQQDDAQKLLLEIQHKMNLVHPETEELKNQFLRKIFLNITGTDLPFDNDTLDLFKKILELDISTLSEGFNHLPSAIRALLNSYFYKVDIQAHLFASFKHAPTPIRMLWNSYSYDKKVNQVLVLELLLQGFVIYIMAKLRLQITNDTPPALPPFSYLKMATLGGKLIL